MLAQECRWTLRLLGFVTTGDEHGGVGEPEAGQGRTRFPPNAVIRAKV